MRLLEVVVEGVEGARGILRYPFEKGLNAWKQKGAVPLSALVDILESLLYPVPESGGPLGPARAQKAGVTFDANGITYRLVRDYGGRWLRLSQLDPGSSGRYRELSSDPRFVTAALARAARLPSRAAFRHLLVAAPGGRPVRVSAAEAFDLPETRRDPRQRLEMLRKERERLREVKKLEEAQDRCQERLFGIDDRLRCLREAAGKAKRVRDEYEPCRVFDKPGLVTPQILSRLKSYPALLERKAAELAALEEKARRLEEEIAKAVPAPFWRHPLTYCGGAAALVSFVAASFLPREWVGVMLGLMAAGLGVLVWGIFRGLRREEGIKRLGAEMEGLEAEKGGIEKRFEIEAAPVKKFFEAVGMSDPKEIEETLALRGRLAEERKAAEEELARLLAEVPEEGLVKDRDGTRRELEAVEARLEAMPPVSVDPNSLEREIRDLETAGAAELARAPAAGALDDPIRRLLTHLAELLGRPAAECLAQASGAIATNLSTLTDRRVTGLEARGERILAYRLSDGSRLSWEEADEETRKALLFGVQFTFWQALAARRPLPCVLDLVSFSAGEKAARLMLAAASHLAKKSQVLVLMP